MRLFQLREICNYQNYMDAFMLECSKEDIKHDKYAKQTYKKIKKQIRICKKIEKLGNKFMGEKKMNKEEFKEFLIVFIILFGTLGISWAVTCGIVKLITLCFGWNFSWLIATGIWFACWLLKCVFGGRK